MLEQRQVGRECSQCTNAESPRKRNLTLTPGTLPVTSRRTTNPGSDPSSAPPPPPVSLSLGSRLSRLRCRAHHLLDESPLPPHAAMPTLLAAALLPLPASPALHFPRPRPGPSWRARPAVVRAAALRALPRRLELCPPCLAAVESNPAPPPLAPPPPDEASAGSGAGAARPPSGLLVAPATAGADGLTRALISS
jgi:hypothetical protein